MKNFWIARDSNGDLYLYTKEPEKSNVCFTSSYRNYIEIDANLFPEVTWENSPQEVGIQDLGLEWQKKELINKACEWLKNWASFSVNDTTGSLDEEDLVKRFKAAMQE